MMNESLNSSQRRAVPLFILLLIGLLAASAFGDEVDQEQPDCDVKLLRSYKLKGLRRPSHYAMHMCPHVRTKCCTLTDELSIYQLWKGYAYYNTRKFHNLVVHSWFRMVDYHEQLILMDRNDITVHYMSWRWVPYIHRMCDHRFIESNKSMSNPAPMESEIRINSELPGVGAIRPYHFKYQPDYLDVITKKAHMKKVIEIYKAGLSVIFIKFNQSRDGERKRVGKIQKKMYKEEMQMHKAKVALAYKKIRRKENKLHIFHPKDTLAFVDAKIKLGLVGPIIKMEKKRIKGQVKKFKNKNKELYAVMQMLKFESVLSSLYNVSRIVDYNKLKKYIYHFVLQYRFWHKKKKKIRWNSFRPTMYNVNMMMLPKCPKRVLKWHKKRMFEENRQRLMVIMQKENKKKATIIRRRKQIITAWKKKHMKILKKRNKKLDKLLKRKKKNTENEKKQLQKDKKVKDKLAMIKAGKPSIFGGRRLNRKKGKKSTKGKKNGKERKLYRGRRGGMDDGMGGGMDGGMGGGMDDGMGGGMDGGMGGGMHGGMGGGMHGRRGRRGRGGRRGRRGRGGRRGRRGRKSNFKIPFQYGPTPWTYKKYKIYSDKDIDLRSKRDRYNYKVAAMYRQEAMRLRKLRRRCNYRCRLNKLPKNIDFNNMCILPEDMIVKKRLEFYGKFRKNAKGDWKATGTGSRGFRRKMRRTKRRRSPFAKRKKKRRRRRRRRRLGRKLKQTKKPEEKKEYKALKNASPQERHLSLVSTVTDLIKPFSKSAMKMLSNLYKKPIVQKKDLHSEYVDAQVQTEEKTLSAQDKLEDKVDQMKSKEMVAKQSIDNGIQNGKLSPMASPSQVSLKTGVDLTVPQRNLDLESLESASTTDGLGKDYTRELWNPFKKIKRPKIKNPIGRVKSPFGKVKSPFGKMKSPFGKMKSKSKPPPPIFDNSRMYKNPKGPFYVKPPKIVGGYSPPIDPVRAKKMIKPLLDEKMELTSVPTGFFYKKLKYPLPMIGSLIPRDEKVTCRTFKRHLWKSFINVNKEKIRYCYRIYDSLQSFDTGRFKKSMLIMRMKLFDLLNLKRGFYCAICDYDRQQMFDHENKLIMYNTGFCVNFLTEFKELINFQNVILVEYMDQMLQFIECYRGNGKFFDFPYRTMLEMHKRRIFFIQRCFAHKISNTKDPQEEEGFLKNCMFICNQFNYVKFNTFIDGDLRMMNTVLMRIFQYLREMRFSPYIKAPPYQFTIPYVYPNTKGSELENSRKFSNDVDKFVSKQKKVGNNTIITKKAMAKKNNVEKLRKRVSTLQYGLFFKKQKHFDLAIDSIPFNKTLKKRLKMQELQSIMPPTFIPNKIKMTERARKDLKKRMRRRRRMNRMRDGIKSSTRDIVMKENKILRKVKYAYESAARKHMKYKKKVARLKKDKKKLKKRLFSQSRSLRPEQPVDEQVENLQTKEDLSLMNTYKDLQNDSSYYGIEPATSPTPEVLDSVNLSTQDLVNQKIIPERVLSMSSLGIKKKKKKIKKKTKKKKKNIIILTHKVKNFKTGEYKTEKVAHKVTNWRKYKRKMLRKKKKKFDRFKEITQRQSGNFGFYPTDSEHIMHGIYAEKRQFYDLKKYRAMYLVHMNGLDPMMDRDYMDLEIDPLSLIRREYNVKNPEAFDQKVILQYFGIPNQTISDFNADIDDHKFIDMVHLKEQKKANKPKKKKKNKYKKRNKRKMMNPSQLHKHMMKKHHVYSKKHKNPQSHDLGLDEFDPATTADTDSQLMFYMFDHRSRYPIFRNS